jgi:hypothetical protein
MRGHRNATTLETTLVPIIEPILSPIWVAIIFRARRAQ